MKHLFAGYDSFSALYRAEIFHGDFSENETMLDKVSEYIKTHDKGAETVDELVRELYSAPHVWVSAQKCRIQRRGDKFVCYDKFSVGHIVYSDEREIVGLTIINSDTGEVVYNGYKRSQKKTA